MKILIISAAYKNILNSNLANMLTAANKIYPKCELLLIGDKLDIAAAQAAKYDCITKVHTLEAKNLLADSLAKPLAEFIMGYTHILTAADSFGKDLLPRIAGVADLSQISEIVEVISPNTFKRPIYAGNVIAEVESFEEHKLLTVRATNFKAYDKQTNSAEITPLVLANINTKINSEIISQEFAEIETADLSNAKIVVSGGHSLGSKENFDTHIRGLAKKLNAAVGATRAAVEAAYASNDSQIGQTGKVVAPQVYLAIGVSGAVQHLAGMKDSQNVIAINNDPNAQIFEYADYGIVGDLFEILPELISKL